MEDKKDIREMDEEKLEQVTGGAAPTEGYHCSNENCLRHRMFLDKQGTCRLCGAELVYGKMELIT